MIVWVCTRSLASSGRVSSLIVRVMIVRNCA